MQLGAGPLNHVCRDVESPEVTREEMGVFWGSQKLDTRCPQSWDSRDHNMTGGLRLTHWLQLYFQGEFFFFFNLSDNLDMTWIVELEYRWMLSLKWPGLWSVARKKSGSGLFWWHRQKCSPGQPVCTYRPTTYWGPRPPSLVLITTRTREIVPLKVEVNEFWDLEVDLEKQFSASKHIQKCDEMNLN